MSIKWNGGSPEAAINNVLFPQIRDNMAKALRAARCPEHGTHPTKVEVTGHDMKSLEWRVYGCCPEKLREAGLRALR
jgi:hypothetical protein